MFDGEGPDGRPYASRPPVDPAERAVLIAYLERAPIVLAARGFDTDRLDPGGRKDVPMTFHTDGTWIWAEGVGYYLREHDVAPEPDLVDHIRRAGFRLPDVDERARDRAVSAIGDASVRPAAPGRRSPVPPAATAPGRAPAPGGELPVQPLPGEPPLSLLRDRRIVDLPVGAEVDRYGDTAGNFMFAARTPYEHRSFPVEWQSRARRVYRLRRPLRVLTGVAIPWFEQPGGGIAYVLPRSVTDLLADGALEEVPGG